MKSKGPNYSNHNSSPGPVAELSCRLVLNLTQFPNPQSRLLFWAGCQAERTITNWFPTGGGGGRGGWDPSFTSAGLKSSKHLLQTRYVDRLKVTSHKLILSFHIALSVSYVVYFHFRWLMSWFGSPSRDERACWPGTDHKEHKGCDQSSFPMEVCKTSFSGTLKHQKANRPLTLAPLESFVPATPCVCVCCCLVSVSRSVSLSLSSRLFSFDLILAAHPSQTKQFKPLYLLLLSLSSVDCSRTAADETFFSYGPALTDHICCLIITLFHTSFVCFSARDLSSRLENVSVHTFFLCERWMNA